MSTKLQLVANVFFILSINALFTSLRQVPTAGSSVSLSPRLRTGFVLLALGRRWLGRSIRWRQQRFDIRLSRRHCPLLSTGSVCLGTLQVGGGSEPYSSWRHLFTGRRLSLGHRWLCQSCEVMKWDCGFTGWRLNRRRLRLTCRIMGRGCRLIDWQLSLNCRRLRWAQCGWTVLRQWRDLGCGRRGRVHLGHGRWRLGGSGRGSGRWQLRSGWWSLQMGIDWTAGVLSSSLSSFHLGNVTLSILDDLGDNCCFALLEPGNVAKDNLSICIQWTEKRTRSTTLTCPQPMVWFQAHPPHLTQGIPSSHPSHPAYCSRILRNWTGHHCRSISVTSSRMRVT